MKFICELPPGNWTMQTDGKNIFLVCPDHPLMAIRDRMVLVLGPNGWKRK